MPTRIDHLGIAVRSLENAEPLFRKLLGKDPKGRETVASEGVEVSFFELGESRVELIQPVDASSSMHRAIEKRGEGIHHVCLAVDDIEAEVTRLTAEGFQFVGQAPRPGAGGCQVAFIHPKSANGILVELSQSGPDGGH